MDERRQTTSRWVRFGGFEVDLRSGDLSRQGRRIRSLPEKQFEVLVALLERPGELVTRQELQERLWSDTIVDFDNSLNTAVSRLRENLYDSAKGPRFIETVPRKGYRFVGPPPVWDGAERVEPDLGPNRRRRPGIALAALLAAAALAVVWFASRSEGPPPEPPANSGRHMLAVLPFANLSGDPRQEHLANGLTEDLLTRLGGIAPERLGVIARTSTRRYRNSEKSIAEIGAELGVDSIIEGSVRARGERLRIAVQLIRVSDQSHLWAQSYDRDMSDLLELESDFSIRVARAVLPRLLRFEAEQIVAGTAGTSNAQAFEEYLEGLYDLVEGDAAGKRRAREHFATAVDLDPDYARAWAALAEARNRVWFDAATIEEADRIAEQARVAAKKALELDPSLPEAYVALAFSRLYHDWDARAAADALGPPLEGSPNSAAARRLAAAAFSALARHEAALATVAEAVILDPMSAGLRVEQGWYQLFAGRPAAAAASCREALELDPEGEGATQCLYQALLRNGEFSEAASVFGDSLIQEGVPRERFGSLDPEDPARAIPELERIRLERIFAERENDPRAPFDAAVAFTLLDEIDRAFAGLEMAIERRDSRVLYLGVDPRFEALREDPRFEGLLRRSGSAIRHPSE